MNDKPSANDKLRESGYIEGIAYLNKISYPDNFWNKLEQYFKIKMGRESSTLYYSEGSIVSVPELPNSFLASDIND
jgi:hypothetical protein